VAAGARSVADLLHEKTGLYFSTNVATEYAGVDRGTIQRSTRGTHGIAVWFIAITVAILDYVSAGIRQRFV